MTQTPETGTIGSGGRTGNGLNGSTEHPNLFASLETQLEQVPSLADRITRKHWPQAEREQYPFWAGILILALLGAMGMVLSYLQIMTRFALAIAVIMIIGIVPLVIFYVYSLQGRFRRQWELIAGDGELFRFMRDSGFILGHHVEVGQADERPSMHLPVSFPEVVRATENWLRYTALPDPLPPDPPPGLFVPAVSINQPSGSETHRVYEAEYRGSMVRALSLRVDSANSGSEITIGFTLRPSSAETREKIRDALTGRLNDRLIAARIMGDIREACGLNPEPIPMTEAEYPVGEAVTMQPG
jgi:hypothetical protein